MVVLFVVAAVTSAMRAIVKIGDGDMMWGVDCLALTTLFLVEASRQQERWR